MERRGGVSPLAIKNQSAFSTELNANEKYMILCFFCAALSGGNIKQGLQLNPDIIVADDISEGGYYGVSFIFSIFAHEIKKAEKENQH